VVAIACYHYFMIRLSWEHAYSFVDGKYDPSGRSFNDFYRYADWILTVPLLMVELVAVLNLAKATAQPMLAKLVIAAALMIALGYPGEVISSPDRWTERVIWGSLSSVPFFYLLYVLWVELTKSLDSQPLQARRLIEVARLVILVTWAVYPIAYALGGTEAALKAKSSSGGDANYIVALQIGYSLADITAKAGFGILIYFIARAKTEALGPVPESERGMPAYATT
jgi:bacteriorhodopsin